MSVVRGQVRAIAAFAALLFCTVSNAQSLDHLQSLKGVDYHHVESESIGRGFHVYVRVPPDYADGNKKYPTVFILDGGNLFSLFSGYMSYLTFAQESPEVILVGLSYGSNTFAGGNHRGTDFTAPSDEREHYGGASNFQALLRETVIPLVESNYRADSKRRVIFGQSLGGQFVLFSAQTDPDLFWGHIASNAALHRNLDFFLETEPGRRSRSRVFVAGAEHDDRRFRNPRQKWIEHWTAKRNLPWQLKVVELPGHSHMSAPPASFRLGMRWLFNRD